MIGLLAAVGCWLLVSLQHGRQSLPVADEAPIHSDQTLPQLPVPQALLPLTPQEAEKANEEIPFVSDPPEPARPLVYVADDALGLSRKKAIDCLTAAIYYEAGSESAQGKRAVAQVILNRVRHPAFPMSICGVVYQGSERSTGCQFTFTCDGSLLRQPSRAGWDNARKIAAEALDGHVEPAVGMATHYHANYVVPYWASSLDKITAIGTHLFYRWKGAWGRRNAFTQRALPESTGGGEVLPEVNVPLADPVVVDKIDGFGMPEALQSRILADAVKSVPAPETAILQKPASDLKADQSESRLIVDDNRAKLRGEEAE
ncbi:cell wall hydrolase [Tsuneonella amylolytica]|uniref:cell wall hydrolase n=1 Tax=Tsuneonella amylolytica TaxID=2338327 RepID=UPI002D780840|nr:cell wall hydrolase [Tsuneonella amylolytica]